MALLLAGCAGDRPVTAFAASSLRELVSELAPEARLQFDASSTLARQIEQGAPADLFVTADPAWLDRIKTLDRYAWIGNRVVWVGKKEPIRSIALAGEEVPLGKYARLAIEQARLTLPDRIIYGSNARDVLSKVSSGAADAAIVFATDAALDPSLPVVRTFDVRMTYWVALLTPRGRELFERLRSGVDAARRRGFTE